MEGCRRVEVLNVQLLTIKNCFDQVFRIIRAYWRVFVVRPLAEFGVAGITDPSHNPEKYEISQPRDGIPRDSAQLATAVLELLC